MEHLPNQLKELKKEKFLISTVLLFMGYILQNFFLREAILITLFLFEV